MKLSKWFTKDRESGVVECNYGIEMSSELLDEIRTKHYNSLEGYKTVIVNNVFYVSYPVGSAMTVKELDTGDFNYLDFSMLANIMKQLKELPKVI